jgi:hypothetical protein
MLLKEKVGARAEVHHYDACLTFPLIAYKLFQLKFVSQSNDISKV